MSNEEGERINNTLISYNFEQKAYQIMNINYVANRIVCVEDEVKHTHLYYPWLMTAITSLWERNAGRWRATWKLSTIHIRGPRWCKIPPACPPPEKRLGRKGKAHADKAVMERIKCMYNLLRILAPEDHTGGSHGARWAEWLNCYSVAE